MEHSDFLLKKIVLIILTAVVVVAIFKKLRLSPVLGYFVSGAIIGENGLKIILSKDVDFFGEIGVVFLLFAIGLELTFERLNSMRKQVFGFGSAQVLLSILIMGGIARTLDMSMNAAIIIGGGLALSSTAIVLQVLAESREQSTQVGRLSLSTLLMQDFAVVPLLIAIPILATNGDGGSIGILKPIVEALIKALCALIVIFIFGRAFLRPIFHGISSSNSAESNEIFMATTILIALGAAFTTYSMGLSLALGAFVAGLLVAETEFQLQAEESIAPFKSLLLGLFFMKVGMSIDVNMIIEKLHTVALISVGIIMIKAIIISLLCVIFRFSTAVALHTGLLLAQGGEFAFILFGLAKDNYIIDDDVGQILMLVVTITMAFTPLLAILGKALAIKLEGGKKESAYDKAQQEVADLSNHVLILGFGRVGEMVAKLMEAENINYVAVDIDPEMVSEQRKKGYPVYLGDAASKEMLLSIGIERAGSVIMAMSNKITLMKAAKLISSIYPDIPIVARSNDLKKADEYYDNGVKILVPETYETGLQLGGAVLKTIGVSEFEVSRIKNQFRAGNYVRLPDMDEDDV